MSNSKKPEDQKTKASATELDESDLNDVEGGASFLKIDTIEGESLKLDRTAVKLTDKSTTATRSEDISLNYTVIKNKF